MTGTSVLFCCDQATIPADIAGQPRWLRYDLRSYGTRTPELNLRVQSLAGTILHSVEDRAADLVRVASYVYAADQMVSRGGPADVYGKQWRRELALCIPVSEPEIWMQDDVCEHLAAALAFLTDDIWTFFFCAAPTELRQIPLDIADTRILGNPDSVVLFSGGADSFASAVEEAGTGFGRPVIISHRPAPNIDARQRQLVGHLRQRFTHWGFPHLSFAIHRRGGDAMDTSQRSRAFLYACLGAAVATQLGIDRVLFGDNGIVSLNLPINDQLVGALASRGTHPTFLALFNDFATSLFRHPINLINPIAFQTRAEVLAILKGHDCATLLQETISCSHVRGRPSSQPQCGFCSQCVDRRFGAIAAQLEEHDLPGRYGLDIFTDALPEGEARTIALSYVRFAQRVDALTPDDLLLEFPQLLAGIRSDDPALADTAEQLISLLKRHAANVLTVLASMIERHSEDLARGSIAVDSLIRLVAGDGQLAKDDTIDAANEFRREGQSWLVVFRGRSTRLKDSTGLTYVARLLAQPEQDFHVMDLASNFGSIAPPIESTTMRRAATNQLAAEGIYLTQQPNEPLLDQKAKTAYRQRLIVLDEERQRATEQQNTNLVAVIEREMQELEHALTAASGLGQRPRNFRDDNARTRDRVTKAMKRALQTIAEYHPQLGRHLDQTLRTGWFCSYLPETPTEWKISL